MILEAACAFGLEFVVKRELADLGYSAKTSQPGRVEFEGDFSAVVRTNLWLRSADRVLIRMAKFDCPDFDVLFDTLRERNWAEWLEPDSKFPVTGRSRKSALTSVPAIQRTAKRAIVEGLMRDHQVNELPETGTKFGFDIALLDDVATLTLDTTGASLHKRGYRKLVGEAPIKETLAAALVLLSVWNPDRPLVDPFCGSGTIPIEAAWIANQTAPGINREFACQHWPLISKDLWRSEIDAALEKQTRLPLQIIGTDTNAEVLELARIHAKNAGVSEQVHFQQKPFSELRSKREYGCVITNPPYGERLEEHKKLIPLYREFPVVLQRLPTWSHFIITSMHLEKIIGQRATRRRKLFNGRIECQYFQFLGPKPPPLHKPPVAGDPATSAAPASSVPTKPKRKKLKQFLDPSASSTATNQPHSHGSQSNVMTPNENDGKTEFKSFTTQDALPAEDKTKLPSSDPISDPIPRAPNSNDFPNSNEPPSPSPNVRPVFGGLDEKARSQAELFSTRLRKRAKHLRRYPKKGIHCYRLYEKDIPELPFVVDIYDDSLHITEYERPHDRNLGQHGAWLELMKKTAGLALDVPIQKVFLKSRERQKGARQYEKVSDHRKLKQVEENGLTFLVNLSDYVDTGLFLDHRQTRQMVREESNGKRFLNLFAYTGAFSVYAAAGGAVSTTTVDLSKNYLDWAERNLKTNGFDSPEHQFVHSDARQFIQTSRQHKQTFDLVVVDPPTFSNSKQTEFDWEVQSGHTELLTALTSILSPNAVVYFSTNFRRFKLQESDLSVYFQCIEISRQTVPDDFRNKRIHRCWKLLFNSTST